MEGFAKLAGVQDASHLTSSTADTIPNNYPPPPPIPEDRDPEATTQHSLTPRPSRASLPLDRRPSHRTGEDEAQDLSIALNGNPYTTTRNSTPAVDPNEPSEIPWGPQHPCFPHPNPHVPLNSVAYQRTRVIRIPRDWLAAGDLYPALQNVYPEILAPALPEAEFREVIERLNGMLKEAFGPWGWRSWVDGVMGVLTGWLWEDAGLTGVKAKVRGMERLVEEWNRERERRGVQVRLIDLRRTGFLNLDIQIEDPEIDGPGVGGTGEKEGEEAMEATS